MVDVVGGSLCFKQSDVQDLSISLIHVHVLISSKRSSNEMKAAAKAISEDDCFYTTCKLGRKLVSRSIRSTRKPYITAIIVCRIVASNELPAPLVKASGSDLELQI